MKNNECIKSPEDIDWAYFWAKKLEEKNEGKKDWDKVAKTFHKKNRRDDYKNELLNSLILTEEDTVQHKDIGDYDVVIASRSLNNIIPIKDTLNEINKIANKYVFITLFGPENWIIEKEFQEYLGNETKEYPSYLYIIHILEDLGIYPNMERLKINDYNKYSSIEDVIDNGKFRVDLLNDDEIKKLKTYLKEILIKDEETGILYNKRDKADWILIWWKKEEK